MTDIVVPVEVLQIVFDTAINSMDFGSGFLDDEEVTALRDMAMRLGQDPLLATPSGHHKKFYGHVAEAGVVDTRTGLVDADYGTKWTTPTQYRKFIDCAKCYEQ